MSYYSGQDRVVLFDIPESDLHFCKGEKMVDQISHIEDAKGNTGDIGYIILSNLRLIYCSNQSKATNISLGYSTIQDIRDNQITSTVNGQCSATQLICKSGTKRYELQFSSTSEKKIDLCRAITNVMKIYNETKLFRDVREKANLGKNKEFKTLYGEEILDKYESVMFYSKTENKFYKGNATATNVRFAWICSNIDNFNVSIPWVQIEKIFEGNISDKQIPGITINVSVYFSNKDFSFAMNKTKEEFTELINTIRESIDKYKEDPILSIDLEKALKDQAAKKKGMAAQNASGGKADSKSTISKSSVDKKEDLKESSKEGKEKGGDKDKSDKGKSDEEEKPKDKMKFDRKSKKDSKIKSKRSIFENEITNDNYVNEKASALAYMINSESEKSNSINDIIFCTELGVAAQKLPNNVTIDDLWRILK